MDSRLLLLHLFISLCCTASISVGQTRSIDGLPKDALIIEEHTLSASGYRERALVLWMLNPKCTSSGYPDDPYTCPQETRGSSCSGPTRVSLVDTSYRRVINTIELPDPHFDDRDTFDLPYRILPGYYYKTVSTSNRHESKPIILWLRDYNGDGKALEFALFDAAFCMGVQTTLIGYVPEEDRVVQYPIELNVTYNGQTNAETLLWIDYLFSKKPLSPGRWEYEIDYRGRGGALDHFTVKYNRTTRKFQGTLVRTE